MMYDHEGEISSTSWIFPFQAPAELVSQVHMGERERERERERGRERERECVCERENKGISSDQLRWYHFAKVA
jgi:hypothetical protein